MKPREFFDNVARMRDAQRRYFKTRDTADLQKSKALESMIDREIARVLALPGVDPVPPMNINQ